jgi:hypothetical protein
VRNGNYVPFSVPCCVLAACAVLWSGAAYRAEGELRWRVFDQDQTVLLVIADSDATDNFGLPLFEGEKAAGTATAEGDTNDDLRSTIAALMLHDEDAAISLTPGDASAQNARFFFSYLTGWRYRFELSVPGAAFEQLKRAGTFQLKAGGTSVQKEFKVGLESVARFQELCKSPST